MTIREFLFGPTPTITPSDAARALGAEKRRADRQRIADRLVELRADIAAGRVKAGEWPR